MHPEGTILRSVPLFTLTPELIAQLEQARTGDPIEQAHDAFCLFPGLGTPSYLTRSGRILWAVSLWEVAGQRGEAFAAIVVGSWTTGIASLRDLLPRCPASGVSCSACAATGGREVRVSTGESRRIICGTCWGLGWTSPELPMAVSVLEQP